MQQERLKSARALIVPHCPLHSLDGEDLDHDFPFDSSSLFNFAFFFQNREILEFKLSRKFNVIRYVINVKIMKI